MTRVPSTATDPLKKFKELVIYVSGKLEFDPSGGDTKLNKVLFYSDFMAYGKLGKSITGESYTKQQFGPVAKRLLQARAEMGPDDASVITKQTVSGPQTRTIPRREADLSGFSADEIAIVDHVCEHFKGHNSREISLLSHKLRAWKTTRTGEVIPFEMFFLPGEQSPEISGHELEVLQRLEATHGRSSAPGKTP